MVVGITGGRGVIGRILNEKLSAKGYKVSNFTGDVRSREDVCDWLSSENYNAIFHLAAVVPVVEVNQKPLMAYDVNVGGTINVLSSISQSETPPWLFYASTSHVYKSKSSPINENDDIQPISLYGETKYIAEQICQRSLKGELQQHKICCGRIFSFYHETQSLDFLYPKILARLESENLTKPFFLRGAESVRDFLSAEDVADIIIRIMEKRFTGIINIASGKGQKIKDLVQGLSSVELDIHTEGDPDYLVADIDKLDKLLKG